MTKLPISIAVTAAIISIAACDRNKIKSEAEDVREAREEVEEEKQEQREEVTEAEAELEREKAELSAEVQQQIHDLEERYADIEEDAAPAIQKLQAEGTRTQQVTQIEDARSFARTKIDELRNAKTAQEATRALAAAKDALDNFERTVDRYDGNV